MRNTKKEIFQKFLDNFILTRGEFNCHEIDIINNNKIFIVVSHDKILSNCGIKGKNGNQKFYQACICWTRKQALSVVNFFGNNYQEYNYIGIFQPKIIASSHLNFLIKNANECPLWTNIVVNTGLIDINGGLK